METNDQTRHGGRKEDVVHELELMEHSHEKVKQTELGEDKLVIFLYMQITCANSVQKKATTFSKEAIPQILADTLLDAFHVGYDDVKEKCKR